MTEDEKKSAQVLDMCRRFKRDFSLAEIVERVVDERSELMFEFSEIWGGLIRKKSIRALPTGAPSTYQVIDRQP
jgi:hypothetical protein